MVISTLASYSLRSHPKVADCVALMCPTLGLTRRAGCWVAKASSELFDWTQDHQDAVEAFFIDDVEEDEEFEVDDDDDAANDDTEEEGSSDLLAAFYEWLSEATEPMRDDVEAEEENDVALYA